MVDWRKVVDADNDLVVGFAVKGIKCPVCHEGLIMKRLTPKFFEDERGLKGMTMHVCKSCPFYPNRVYPVARKTLRQSRGR